MSPDRPPPGAGRPAPGDTGALPSAAPSTGARVLAVAAIVVAGICGGLIGFGIVDLTVSGQEGASTTDGGGAGPALGALVGAVIAAGGVAVVAVLVLRAMTEWHTIEERARAAGVEPPKRNRRDRRT
ncbi:MAG: hypothetical protein ACR2JF_11050 [Iamia sp.]